MIELTAVLLILAVGAAAVVLHVEGPARRARMEDVVGQFRQFDRLARSYARRQDRALRLVVDLAAGQIRRTDERGTEEPFPPLALPDGYGIARLLVRQQSATSGSVSITCSRLGLTPSYAVLLTGPAGQQKWIVVAGLTGQNQEMGTEEAVKNILATMQARVDTR
jgi:type II secretory pathway pseudopilin PulG